MESLTTDARNTDLPNLVDMLKVQSDVRYDVVVPASGIEMRDGNIIVKDGTARFAEEGLYTEDATLVPTPIFDEGISKRFDIPLKYVRRMRSRVDSDISEMPKDDGTLLDQNVNYWLEAEPNRRHLVRGFLTDGVIRVSPAQSSLTVTGRSTTMTS